MMMFRHTQIVNLFAIIADYSGYRPYSRVVYV